MSFYLKYRPRTIDQLDLVKVREGLLAMLKSGSLPKALLLVGPRGGGKTSAARILAKVINCEKNEAGKLSEPCLTCTMCQAIEKGSAVDVLEMDAASNRGIDAIRDLRERVSLAPVQAKNKVYIIDEVHMLTTEAFNALLKTLEEPPEHAMFILCTTEEHKVPETIKSRCTKVAFYKASADEVRRSLKKAIEGEKIKIEDAALEFLAKSVDGSFREGHKMLELISKEGDIVLDKVKSMLGQNSGVEAVNLAELYLSGETGRILEELSKAEKVGVDWLTLIKNVMDELRSRLRTEVNTERLMKVLKALSIAAVEMKTTLIESLPLEMAAVELGLKHQEEKPVVVVEEKEDVIQKPVIGKPASLKEVEEKWEELLRVLAPKNHSVAGLLRATRPIAVEDSRLIIEVFYKFHKEQLEQDAKRRLLEDTLNETLGLTTVRLVMGEGQPIKHDTKIISEAETIFGS